MPAIDTPAGWSVRHTPEIGSTNDAAARLAGEGAGEGTVVWADLQRTGRGRSGRQWASPPGNLYCSVVLRPGADLSAAGNLSFVVAVALRAAIARLFPRAAPVLKWPNDILNADGKLAGILLEAGESGQGPYVVAGTGVNIAGAPNGEAAALRPFADEGEPPGAAELLTAYLAELAGRLAAWREGGFGPIREEWLTHCIGLGRPVTVRADGASDEGVFEALDSNGALILRRAGGDTRAVLAADVFFPQAVEGHS